MSTDDDKALSHELHAAELDAVATGDDMSALALKAARFLHQHRDEAALARLGAFFGGLALTRYRGNFRGEKAETQGTLGPMFRASRAIVHFLDQGQGPGESLERLTIDELLRALGRETAARDRVDGQIVQLRVDLAQALAIGEAARTELEGAKRTIETLRAQLDEARHKSPKPPSVRVPESPRPS